MPPDATTHYPAGAAPVVEELSEVEHPPVPAPASATTIHVTLPAASPGSPPHRHPGPAFGYIIDGEMMFEVEGEPPRVVKTGESFWEPGGDVIHYQDGNHLTDAETTFVVVILGVPGQPLLTPVPPEELEARRSRRATQP